MVPKRFYLLLSRGYEDSGCIMQSRVTSSLENSIYKLLYVAGAEAASVISTNIDIIGEFGRIFGLQDDEGPR